MESFAKLKVQGVPRRILREQGNLNRWPILSSKSSGKRQRERKMEKQGKNQRGVGLQSIWFRKGCDALLATLASLGDSGDWGLALSDSTVWQGLDYAGNGSTSAPGVQRERNAIGCSGIPPQVRVPHRTLLLGVSDRTLDLSHQRVG